MTRKTLDNTALTLNLLIVNVVLIYLFSFFLLKLYYKIIFIAKIKIQLYLSYDVFTLTIKLHDRLCFYNINYNFDNFLCVRIDKNVHKSFHC